MAALSFAGGLRIESNEKLTSPQAARTHDRGPSIEEPDQIELPDHGYFAKAQSGNITSTPAGPQTPTPARTGYQTPKTPNELESSLPPTPRQHDATGIVPSWSYPAMNKWRVLCACLIYLGNGMNDSAPGALIPYMETFYHIGYAVVSMIWVANAVGFILAAFCTDALRDRVGRARALMVSELIMVAGYVMLACSPPFGATVCIFEGGLQCWRHQANVNS